MRNYRDKLERKKRIREFEKLLESESAKNLTKIISESIRSEIKVITGKISPVSVHLAGNTPREKIDIFSKKLVYIITITLGTYYFGKISSKIFLHNFPFENNEYIYAGLSVAGIGLVFKIVNDFLNAFISFWSESNWVLGGIRYAIVVFILFSSFFLAPQVANQAKNSFEKAATIHIFPISRHEMESRNSFIILNGLEKSIRLTEPEKNEFIRFSFPFFEEGEHYFTIEQESQLNSIADALSRCISLGNDVIELQTIGYTSSAKVHSILFDDCDNNQCLAESRANQAMNILNNRFVSNGIDIESKVIYIEPRIFTNSVGEHHDIQDIYMDKENELSYERSIGSLNRRVEIVVTKAGACIKHE